MSVTDHDVPAVPASNAAGEAVMKDWAEMLVGRARAEGVELTGGEGAKQWATMLTELRNRGLADALIVCCDGLRGLPESIRATWPNATVQTLKLTEVVDSRVFSCLERTAILRPMMMASWLCSTGGF